MSEYSRVESVSEIDGLVEKSRQAPVMLFKHSLTCPVSSTALRQYQSFLDGRPEGDAGVYTLVEVQNARDVSNEIARRTGVRHESPQALLLRDGEVAWHASHWSIKAEALASAVDAG